MPIEQKTQYSRKSFMHFAYAFSVFCGILFQKEGYHG